MSAIAGKDGAVKNGANTVLNMTDWSLDLGGDTEDTTSFQPTSGWRANTSTVKKWAAKCSGNYDGADTNGQVALNAGLLNSFTMNFYVDATHYWSGSALLVGIAPKAAATGLVKVEYSFTGTGACTFT